MSTERTVQNDDISLSLASSAGASRSACRRFRLAQKATVGPRPLAECGKSRRRETERASQLETSGPVPLLYSRHAPAGPGSGAAAGRTRTDPPPRGRHRHHHCAGPFRQYGGGRRAEAHDQNDAGNIRARKRFAEKPDPDRERGDRKIHSGASQRPHRADRVRSAALYGVSADSRPRLAARESGKP